MIRSQPPRFGSDGQNAWLDGLSNMGGQFWPSEAEEEDMPEVGAKYPMMLYDGTREVIVYDEKERAEAKKNGFSPHPSMEAKPPDKPIIPPDKLPPPVVKDVPYLSQDGDLMTCTMGNWTGDPDTYKYQYRRDTNTLIGTGSSEYVVTPADVGRSLDCVVEASNAGGKGSSTSNKVVVTSPEQQKASVTVERKVTVTPPPSPATQKAVPKPTVPPPVSAPAKAQTQTQTPPPKKG